MGKIRCGITPRSATTEHFVTSEYAIMCVLKGYGIYTDSDGMEYPFGQDTFIQRFPNNPHSITWQIPGITSYLAAPGAMYDLFYSIIGQSIRKSPIITVKGLQDSFSHECLGVRAMLETKPESCYMDTVNRIQVIFTRVLICTRYQINSSESLVKQLDDLLCKDSGYRFSMKELASQFSMSSSSFRDKFSKEAGVSPGFFIIRKRLEEARRLLLENKLTINEIANQLNYPDIYSFSKQFKKFIGKSPRQYQQSPES